MTVKLLMSWDILPGREQEYFEFVVREFIPRIQRLGLEPTDAWFTMYGEDKPQILAGVQMSSKPALERILESPDWKQLIDELMEYVEEFKTKIVPARKGFQL
ncbi:MAG TPA: hypothetical protein VIK64_18335 [Anaerolineales bacterium]